MDIHGSTVLITGATGFTGSFVAERLAREGVRVRALVRREGARVPDAATVVGDLRDPASLAAAVEGVDAVVHCAVAYRLDIEEARRLTVEGTRALAEGALAAGCRRFVHLSTISVYAIDGLDVVDEDSPLLGPERAEEDPYGVSKAEAERALAEVAGRGLATVVLRPPAILGPHLRCGWTVRVAADVARGALGYQGDGREQLPYVYVENLADAVVLALENDAAVGGAFNVIDGHVPWQAYLEHVAQVVGRPLSPDADADGRMDGSFQIYDGARLREALGYRPRVAYDEALSRIDAFVTERVARGDAAPQ
jgi:nucleoside-diphosphate-sugar epimerase